MAGITQPRMGWGGQRGGPALRRRASRADIRHRHPAARLRPGLPARRLSPGSELVTVLLGLWLMVGLFVDGWAHTNVAQLESFFTPWHALFYSGFAATAAWMGWRLVKEQESGRRGRAAVPVGYGTGLVGVVLFAAGGLGDMLWHLAFGVEQGIDALFSPTHLLLFTGILAILTSPLRAAWSDPGEDRRPSLAAFLPVLLSVTLTTALVAFMFMYFSAFTGNPAAADWVHWAAAQPGEGYGVLVLEEGIARVLATNVILLAPVLLLVRRWRPPFGSVTVLWTTVALLSTAITEFRSVELTAAAFAGGLAVDTLLRRLRASPRRPQALWLLGAVAPVPLWSGYFAVTALTRGLGWSAELWSGAIVWTALLGGLLALLCQPPLAGGTGGPGPGTAVAAPPGAGSATPAGRERP